MSNSAKQHLREGYNRIKKIFERVLKPKSKTPTPSLVLQPVRRHHLRGTDHY